MVGDISQAMDGVYFYFKGYNDSIKIFIKEMLLIVKNAKVKS